MSLNILFRLDQGLIWSSVAKTRQIQKALKTLPNERLFIVVVVFLKFECFKLFQERYLNTVSPPTI